MSQHPRGQSTPHCPLTSRPVSSSRAENFSPVIQEFNKYPSPNRAQTRANARDPAQANHI